MQDLDQKLANVMHLQSDQYEATVLSFLRSKEAELNTILEQLIAKNNQETDKDKEIIMLKR